MARSLDQIATRMWLLAGLMTTITLMVGTTCFYVASYFELHQARAHMPPGIQAELDHLIATGQRGTDRYYELFDRYTGSQLRTTDLPFLAAIAAISTVIGGGIAFVFARRLSRPITDVARAAVLVASGDHSVRVDEGRASGETGELVRSFNEMANVIETYERERTVLTAGIAHELRTPLTILRGRLHALNDGVIVPDAGEAQRLLRQVDALGRLVEDLRTLAHADAGELHLDLRQVDLAMIAETVAHDLKEQADAGGATIGLRIEPVSVIGDPLRLGQILTNLTTNAIKHSPAGGHVEIVVERREGSAVAAVSDQGAGFLEEDRSRLFLPFWRGVADRAARKAGSGMGLALAARLAELHHGRISAENRSDCLGAVFTLLLPVNAKKKHRAASHGRTRAGQRS
jgi:two-component system sensor histidine kinase AdeS